MIKRTLPFLLASFLMMFTGCELGSGDGLDAGAQADHASAEAVADAALGGNTEPIVNLSGESTDLNPDLSNVNFLHADVSGWPITSSLPEVTVNGGTINLPYDKANSWPTASTRASNGGPLNATAWVLVKVDGQWYAGVWDWLRTGQTSKAVSAVQGGNGHIPMAPLNTWRPRSGEVYGFMVSGVARTSDRNVEERTNVVLIRWP